VTLYGASSAVRAMGAGLLPNAKTERLEFLSAAAAVPAPDVDKRGSRLRLECRRGCSHQHITVLGEVQPILGLQLVDFPAAHALPRAAMSDVIGEIVEAALPADDDYVVVGDGAEGLVHGAALARALLQCPVPDALLERAGLVAMLSLDTPTARPGSRTPSRRRSLFAGSGHSLRTPFVLNLACARTAALTTEAHCGCSRK